MMVTLHKLNGDEFTLNESHIETLEARPDTIVTLTNDRKLIVRERIDEIIEMIAAYQRSVLMAEKK